MVGEQGERGAKFVERTGRQIQVLHGLRDRYHQGAVLDPKLEFVVDRVAIAHGDGFWCRSRFKHLLPPRLLYRSSPWQKSRIRPGPGAAEPRRLHGMAMGKRPVARQASPLWVETADLPTSDGHPFFERLNRVLEDCGFDAFVEGLCSAFYAARMGRPSLRPGRYFRMLLIGYFEGLSSERGIAWRVADSLSLRSFLDLELTESAPDHSTLSRTRRLIDVETHEAVFTWVLERLSEAGLVVGKTVGIDATTLEANAGDAEHRASGHGRILRGVHSAVGGSVGCGDADAGGAGSVRPVSEEQEDVEQGVEIAAGS